MKRKRHNLNTQNIRFITENRLKSDQWIADRIGCVRQTVMNARIAWGIERVTPRPFRIKMSQEAIKIIKDNPFATVHELCRLTGYSMHPVVRERKKLNFKYLIKT
jgi:hypothetical protein